MAVWCHIFTHPTQSWRSRFVQRLSGGQSEGSCGVPEEGGTLAVAALGRSFAGATAPLPALQLVGA